MKHDPADWGGTRENRAILHSGDAIFVSIESLLPLDLMAVSLRILPELELVPFAYQGLKQMPQGITTSVHGPALREFNQSKAVFVVLHHRSDYSGCDDWVLSRIDDALRRGVAVSIYVVRENTPPVRETLEPLFFRSFPIQVVENVDQFATYFRRDLLRLMASA